MAYAIRTSLERAFNFRIYLGKTDEYQRMSAKAKQLRAKSLSWSEIARKLEATRVSQNGEGFEVQPVIKFGRLVRLPGVAWFDSLRSLTTGTTGTTDISAPRLPAVAQGIRLAKNWPAMSEPRRGESNGHGIRRFEPLGVKPRSAARGGEAPWARMPNGRNGHGIRQFEPP